MAVAITLTGCTTPTHKAIAKTRHTEAAPLFATEEEALAAAEEVYTRYVAVSEAITSEGGTNPERIAPFVSEQWLEHEIEAFKSFASSGRHQVGRSRLYDARLQQYVDSGDGRASISMYTCVDFSNVRFFDSNGIDATPTNRPDVITMVVEFEAESKAELRISSSEPWTGSSSC